MLAAVLMLFPAALAPQELPRSAHAAQTAELAGPVEETDDGAEAAALEARGELFPATATAPGRQPVQAASLIDAERIVFGYLQSEVQVFHTRWHALTHIGSRFVSFNSSGALTGTAAFTGRSSYLKAGGAAQAAGVKVILVLNQFDDTPGGVLESVLTSPARRAALIADLVALLAADTYVQGVSIDFEFAWGTSVRDGLTAFMGELRAALDELDPALELSIYTPAIFSANQWDFDAGTGITPHIDYMLYSMYDWATGLTAHAISDFDNCLGATRMHAFLNAGLPPEKLVLAISAYSRQWVGATGYNAVGSSSSSSGFTDALFDVTQNPVAGGPFTAQYAPGDEAGWYSWTQGTVRTRTWESPAAVEYEVRHALALQDPAGNWSGRRLGGVAFWSLFWMAETSSIDPRTGQAVARTRTYPQLYQLCAEILSTPGTTRFPIDGFEGLDQRWRDPNESPDTLGDADGDSTRSLVAAPAGAPAGSTNALRLDFDLEDAGTLFLAHEVLASPLAPAVPDLNAAAGHFDRTSRLIVHVHSPGLAVETRVRLVLVDADGELEASRAFPVDGPGWHELTWDLTDPASITPVATAEPAFAPGDGILDGRDALGFVGFRVEVADAAVGTLVFDELAYEHADPLGRHYTINELRYAGTTDEFVEVHGPPGPLPAGLVLRVFDGASIVELPLTGSVPANGLFVAGDPGVKQVDQTAGFSLGADDLFDGDPSALQLFDPTTGCVYDSVVYEAHGGLADLISAAARGVTAEGPPWLGEVAPGTDSKGRAYAIGRYPDGADTGVNGRDFALQPSSPGRPNGDTLALPVSIDFSAPPKRAFQTFGAFGVSDPLVAGLPAAADGGGAYRCVDSAGGGVIGALGDGALGSVESFTVRGELYVPSGVAPAQAVAVGICGRQGSRFFGSSQVGASAYESGYWLIFENQPGVGLADGRPDHPSVFELVHATHDNQDGAPTELLGSLSASAAGILEGAWTRFEFVCDPAARPARQLIVRVNDVDVYRGALPAGGPRAGAFQIGFRENHGGLPGPAEGTWIDGLELEPLGTRLAPGGLHPVH